jgi:vancomycin resistance protein YoaR
VVGLDQDIAPRFAAIGTRPREAAFAVTDGRVVVVPSVLGHGVNGDGIATALLTVLPKLQGRTATVELNELRPKLTTEQAQALGIREEMASFTSNYPAGEARVTNIHRAADLIKGSVVMPGETWSMNRTVGERTPGNGFAKGTIISDGHFEKDFGGGVSQVATTAFNAVFFAGLKDVQHHPHSFWIKRYPAGREATVVWPDLDLQFQNDSEHPLYVDASYTNNSVTVRLLGTKKYDQIRTEESARYNIKPAQTKAVYDTSTACVPQEAQPGFEIDVARIFVDKGSEVKREKLHTAYEPANRIICGSPVRTPVATSARPAPGALTLTPSRPGGTGTTGGTTEPEPAGVGVKAGCGTIPSRSCTIGACGGFVTVSQNTRLCAELEPVSEIGTGIDCCGTGGASAASEGSPAPGAAAELGDGSSASETDTEPGEGASGPEAADPRPAQRSTSIIPAVAAVARPVLV